MRAIVNHALRLLGFESNLAILGVGQQALALRFVYIGDPGEAEPTATALRLVATRQP